MRRRLTTAPGWTCPVSSTFQGLRALGLRTGMVICVPTSKCTAVPAEMERKTQRGSGFNALCPLALNLTCREGHDKLPCARADDDTKLPLARDVADAAAPPLTAAVAWATELGQVAGRLTFLRKWGLKFSFPIP